jgi:hypothetical protein
MFGLFILLLNLSSKDTRVFFKRKEIQKKKKIIMAAEKRGVLKSLCPLAQSLASGL